MTNQESTSHPTVGGRQLPAFKYYADPFTAKVFEQSDANCQCCEESTGYIYCGVVYGTSYEENFCPWCIEDGSAAAKFEVEFNSFAPNAVTDKIPREVIDEITKRTPGLLSFQQIDWWCHCEDAGRFLGDVGDIDQSLLNTEEAQDFVQSVREEEALEDDESWSEVLSTRLHERDLGILVFTCLHCGTLSGYTDYS